MHFCTILPVGLFLVMNLIPEKCTIISCYGNIVLYSSVENLLWEQYLIPYHNVETLLCYVLLVDTSRYRNILIFLRNSLFVYWLSLSVSVIKTSVQSTICWHTCLHVELLGFWLSDKLVCLTILVNNRVSLKEIIRE